MGRHSTEANKIRSDLRRELANASESCGLTLEFSAVEQALIRQVVAAVDRKAALEIDWLDATEAKLRLKLATEIRGIEGHVERMLRRIQTNIPAAASTVSAKARTAANARWGRTRSAG